MESIIRIQTCLTRTYLFDLYIGTFKRHLFIVWAHLHLTQYFSWIYKTAASDPLETQFLGVEHQMCISKCF